jgi:hypothetical protein
MGPFLIPLADVGSALTGIAKLFSGYLAGGLGLALVIAGYMYMFALDDHTKASQAKRAIGVAIGGAVLVALGIGIAAKVLVAIGN